MQKDMSTDYEVGQDNINPLGMDIHNPVFAVSGLAIVAFVILTLMFQSQASEFFGWLRPAITGTFDWFFLSAGNLFVIFALGLAVSPLGKIRLGGKTPHRILATLAGSRCCLQPAWV